MPASRLNEIIFWRNIEATTYHAPAATLATLAIPVLDSGIECICALQRHAAYGSYDEPKLIDDAILAAVNIIPHDPLSMLSSYFGPQSVYVDMRSPYIGCQVGTHLSHTCMLDRLDIGHPIRTCFPLLFFRCYVSASVDDDSDGDADKAYVKNKEWRSAKSRQPGSLYIHTARRTPNHRDMDLVHRNKRSTGSGYCNCCWRQTVRNQSRRIALRGLKRNFARMEVSQNHIQKLNRLVIIGSHVLCNEL